MNADDKAVLRSTAVAMAKLAWAEMTDDDKAVVRFGMIPFWAHEKYATQILCPPNEASRLFAVAVMDCAKADGGMVA